MGSHRCQVVLCSAHSVFGFYAADNRNVVKGIVALAAHTVKQRERGVKTRSEMLLSELDDGDVVSELHSGSLAVAEHQGEGALEHGLVGRLISGFLIDGEVFAGGGCLFQCVGEKQLDLLRIHPLRFGLRSGQSARRAFRSRYPRRTRSLP